MEPTSQQLEEVYVTAKKEGGTYVDVTQTRLQPTDATQWMGGSIGDVLRTEPSVTIDPNGNVSLRGNGNVLLLLDGVPTNLGSIDAIPSSNVASIDIIKNPNATYDAEGTGGIINIVTKKDGKKGLSGMAAVNYGFNHFTNGCLALNYTKNKFAFRFNYQLKYEDDVNNGYLYRYYRTTGDSLSQQIHALRTTFNNKAKKWHLSTGLYANYIHNYITQVARFEGDVLLMTYINATSQTKAGLDLNLSVDPWKWMSLVAGTNTYYLRSVGNIDSWDISNSGWVNNSNVQVNFKPIKGMNISLQYFLNTPQYFPQFTTLFSHYMNIGISQKFLKGALTVSAQLTDVFNTRKWEVFSDNQYYRLENMLKNKSRMFWLGISYNFNAYKKSGAPKPSGDDRSIIRTGV